MDDVAHDTVLNISERGDRAVVGKFEGKDLTHPWAANVIDLCPVGALLSKDFLNKARAWELDRAASICPNCTQGCNIMIEIRDNSVARLKPRPNEDVNKFFMCDYGRLNFAYVGSEKRLLEPRIFHDNKLVPSDWKTAITHAALQLKHFGGWEIAIVASGRMTNEELWLTAQLARSVGAQFVDIVPRRGTGDNILLSEDRNPNTNGAHLLGLTNDPGANLPAISDAVTSGQVKALVCLGENPLKFGLSTDQLSRLPAFIFMNLLANEATEFATAILPSAAFAEKRGSMINGKGRLQRLNRAVRPPGQARDDWEILRDLNHALTGSNGIYTIEDVFRQMSETVPAFAGLTLSKIGDLGIQVLPVAESQASPNSPAATQVAHTTA